MCGRQAPKFLIISAKSFLPYRVTNSQVLGIRVYTCLGDTDQPTHSVLYLSEHFHNLKGVCKMKMQDPGSKDGKNFIQGQQSIRPGAGPF